MPRRGMIVLLLLLAFPAHATEADSCKATAESLDSAYRQADAAYQRGNVNEAGSIRRSYQQGVNTFMDICLRPRVCPSYFRERQAWLPPEYSKTATEFTAFMDMWREADKTTTMCSEADCAALAQEADRRKAAGKAEQASRWELTYSYHCVRNCSQPTPTALQDASLFTQWQQHDRIYCRK